VRCHRISTFHAAKKTIVGSLEASVTLAVSPL